MFIGRTSEIKTMQSFYDNPDAKALIMYGRRRVGKSELINQTLKLSKKKNLYYECKQTTEKNNVESIVELLNDLYNLPPLKINSFEELLKYICSLCKDEELILVLDEYSYLQEIIPGLDSILQLIIDQNKKSKLKIIICGSYIDIMKKLLDVDNPLYGRFDYKIELKPMDYYDSSLFYSNFSNEDKVRLYSVFGGIPYYNKLIDPRKSVKENIIELIASNGARLENEISSFLKTQLSKINNANEAIELISRGYYKYKDIFDNSGISKGPTLVDALDKLVSMDLIQKVTPINDENNKKKTGYLIKDQLSNFYYNYIFRNKSRLRIMDANYFYDNYIKEDFETKYVPKAFEQISKEYLIRKNMANVINPFDNIGKYYYDDPINHKNGEFDLVTVKNNKYTFYEVKFKKNPLSKKEVDDEIKQVYECGIDCDKFGFISRSGFSFEDKSLILITLDDIYH